MKQIFRIFTLIAVAMLTAEQAWAGSAADLGSIKTGTVTGGTLKFYKEATCETEISTNSNLYSSDLTDGKVYIKAMADGIHSAVNVTFTAQVSTTSSPAQARSITRGSTAPGIGDAITVSPVSGKPGIYSFTMPTDGSNANVSASFPAKTKTNVSYIDIDGQAKQAEAYVLDGTETTLGEPGGTSSSPKETWYICDKNLSYTTFNFSYNCNVNIILADNVEMSVINSNGHAISDPYDSQDSFGVYGQSKGSDRGALTACTTLSGGYAINMTGDVIISHCKLTAEAVSFGIRTYGSGKDVTISNAEVTANGTNGCAIWSFGGGVTITGGTVTAKGSSYGIRACGSGKDVTISGAKVTATATDHYAIWSEYGGVSITGGTVIAEGGSFGIRANGSGKDVTIINAEVTANATNGYAIWSENGGVSITGGTVIAEGKDYGINANGTGKDVTISNAEVTAKAPGTYGYAICSQNGGVSIIGGTVTAVGDNYGIRAGGSGKDVTISGAKVTATATDDYAIYSYDGNVSITGGTVTANGTKGIFSSGDIILSWTSATDFICANRYYVGDGKAVKIAAGKRFVAYNMASESDISANCIIGDATSTDATAIATDISLADATAAKTIAGKTLKPLDGYTVSTTDDKISITVGSTAKKADFTITTGAGTESEVTTPYYIYKASTQEAPVTVTLSYSGTNFIKLGGLPEGTTLDAVANQPLQRSFAMPAEDLALTATAVTDLTLSSTSAEYNGAAQTIGIKFGNDAFSSDNYSLGYEIATAFDGETSAPTTFEAATEAKNVGTYRLTLTGLGQYIGTATMAELFTITPATLTGVTASVASVLTYTGNALSPEVTVSYPNGDETKAIDAADYTVGYQKQTSTDPVVYEEVSEVKGIGTYVAVVTAVTGGNCTFDAVTSNSFEVKYTDGTITQDENGFSVDLTDGENTNPLPFNGKVKDLDYRRTLSGPGSGETGDTKINNQPVNLFTVCLPFAPKTGTGVKYYTLNSVNDKTLKFIEITGDPVAFTPYMVAVTSNVTDFKEQCNDVSFNTDDAITSKPVTSTNNKIFTFTGTLTGLTSTDAAAAAGTGMVTYILQHQAKWGKVVSGDAKVKIPPFRAFIIGPAVPSNGNARELDSTFDDDATGIQNIVTVDRDGTERWYDLNGRRIDQPTKKGIYINNGKKVIKK